MFSPICLLALLASPALAQDEALQSPSTVAPDALSQAQAAAARGDPAEALSRYLRVLASKPDDTAALAGAGRAALDIGDVTAAAGFFARADARDPRNGQVKAGLADVLLQRGDARGALRLFRDAVSLGVPPVAIAADRGLAYDLRGDQRRALADYQLALAAAPKDETIRRLALSQAISGDRVAALATLDPLLRRRDVSAWRTRAFVYALTGDAAQAQADAALVMRREQVDALAPYLPKLAALRPADKAAAVHLGRFPNDQPTRTADARLAAPPPTKTASATTSTSMTSPLMVTPAPAPAKIASAPVSPVLTSSSPVPNSPALASVAPAAGSPDMLTSAPLSPLVASASPIPAATTPPEPAAASAPATPPAPTKAERLADDRARRAEAAARRKADEKRQAEADARDAKRRNPARHWVQVAGGANKHDLGRAWDDLKAKWPKQLAGRSPWTTHYRFTNRLLIGPFPSSGAAQDWVTDRRKEGLPSFRVETNAGDPVERVGG